MSFGFTLLFSVVVKPNLNIYEFDQFDFLSSDLQHNDECHFVVINANKGFNNKDMMEKSSSKVRRVQKIYQVSAAGVVKFITFTHIK